MGGFMGIGKSADEKKAQQTVASAQGNLNNVFNYALPEAKTAQTTGQSTEGGALSTLGKAQDYWDQILSGSRTANLTAASPAVTAINAEADARRRQQAEMGTSRGGGTSALNQQAETDRLAQINNIIAAQRPAAAQGEEQVGGEQAAIGATQLQNALALLGLGTGTAGTNATIGQNAQQLAMNKSAALTQAIGQLAGLGLTAGGGATAGGGFGGALRAVGGY